MTAPVDTPPARVLTIHVVPGDRWLDGSDRDAAIALFDAYRVFYGRGSDPAGAAAFLDARQTRGESTILLARDTTARAVGFCQLYPSWSSVSMAPIVILNDLYVERSARRSGAGAGLLHAAAQWARERGAIRLTLCTAVDNLPAQALYESLGWRRDREFLTYHLT